MADEHQERLLSPTELKVLELHVHKGLSVGQIATSLRRSQGHIQEQLRQTYRLLGVGGAEVSEQEKQEAGRRYLQRRQPAPDPIGDAARGVNLVRVWGSLSSIRIGPRVLAPVAVVAAILVLRPWDLDRQTFDFENGDCERWGMQPLDQPPQPCEGVTLSEQRPYRGRFALQFEPKLYSMDGTQDVGISLDACRKKITAYVYLPDGAPSIPAVIYIQDFLWDWHQSDHRDLLAAQWTTLAFDTRPENWPAPCRTLGVHFTPRDQGLTFPVFIDRVVIED